MAMTDTTQSHLEVLIALLCLGCWLEGWLPIDRLVDTPNAWQKALHAREAH